MTLDVAALRADTPGCDNVMHLNNAGAALQPRPVLETVTSYIRREGEIGGYETAEEYLDYLEGIYTTIAMLIGADAGEIALAPSATAAWDIAFYGLRLGLGDRILTTTSEYASNFIAYLHQRNTTGVVIDVVPGHGRR